MATVEEIREREYKESNREAPLKYVFTSGVWHYFTLNKEDDPYTFDFLLKKMNQENNQRVKKIYYNKIIVRMNIANPIHPPTYQNGVYNVNFMYKDNLFIIIKLTLQNSQSAGITNNM